ncbi:MAG TPA: GNAT family N-acetyltransferase [Acidimicrobiales bacterium]|nr:GNAT family N-acetyltransferase [Acidimicrobiales bacterium]
MSSGAAPADAAAWEPCDAILSDGGTVRIRVITPADGPELIALHERLSDETVYLRFFSYHPHLSEREVARFTTVDGDHRMALIATLRGRIVGVARYDRHTDRPEQAEVAFVVDDAHQGRGLGTLLLEHLAAYARTRGISSFVAETLPQNQPMQEVFRRTGFVEQTRYSDGLVEVVLEIQPTVATVDAIERRWATASARSIERVLRPRSVAVIGCGRSPGGIGHEILRNILAGGYSGPVYPVNPAARSVASVPAYPSVEAVPDGVDLAVIAVPQPLVSAVVEQCAAKGVNGLVVISAGYAETGPAGAAAQRDLVQRSRGSGMRLVGPNCMGVLNTASDVSLNATFAPVAPPPGRIALSSQSGGLGIAVLQEARRRQIGISSFVSVGNKADISGNDLLMYWERDDATDVIMLYLESFGNPRRFARVARQVSRTKPIVAVKAGRSAAGVRAASSHTAALSSPDNAVDALFRQTGVIRVDTLEEMFDVADVLAAQPVPAGRRVAVVGNVGGPGILAADAAEAAGLVIPELSPQTQAQLRGFLPPEAGVRNPVDMVASASAGDYEKAVRTVLADDGVDAVLAIFAPTLAVRSEDVARALVAASADGAKTVVSTFLGQEVDPAALAGPTRRVPAFPFPEPAVHALARAGGYGEWRSRPEGRTLDPRAVRPAQARTVVQAALGREDGDGWLDPGEAAAVLDAYGIDVVATRLAGNAEAAVDAAGGIGWPVALKAVGPTLVHRTDVGGVVLAITSARRLRAEYADMKRRLGGAMTGAAVQAMAGPGIETIVGIIQDRAFGPLLMFGTGGVDVELFEDRSFRSPPLSDLDAAELVREPKGSARLFGYRGAQAVDVPALEDMLMRVGRLAEDLPEVAEMDLNPVMVTAAGPVVVDAKIRVQRPLPQPDPTLRRLS